MGGSRRSCKASSQRARAAIRKGIEAHSTPRVMPATPARPARVQPMAPVRAATLAARAK